MSDKPDQLVPDPTVWNEFGVTSMTGWRWTNDPDLEFPPPIKIRNRCFRSRRMLEEFKARMLQAALAQRNAEKPPNDSSAKNSPKLPTNR